MEKEQQIESLLAHSNDNAIDIGSIGGNEAVKSLANYWQGQDVGKTDMAEDLKSSAIHLLALSLVADGSATDFDEAESIAKHKLS